MKATYLIPLLLCSPCSAAFINPIGGSWTDGAAVAEYVEVPPVFPQDDQRFQVLLTIGDNSHVLSEVVIQHNPTWSWILSDTSIDFYDGMGDLSGEFEFEVPSPVFMRFTNFGGPLSPVLAYLDGTQARGLRRMEAGRHVLSWGVPDVVLNVQQDAWVGSTPVPEPSTGLGILLALGVLVICGKLGWQNQRNRLRTLRSRSFNFFCRCLQPPHCLMCKAEVIAATTSPR